VCTNAPEEYTAMKTEYFSKTVVPIYHILCHDSEEHVQTAFIASNKRFHEESDLLGYNSVQSDESKPTFRRDMSPNLHDLRISQARNQREAGSKQRR
jgi:heat shock protein HspQ